MHRQFCHALVKTVVFRLVIDAFDLLMLSEWLVDVSALQILLENVAGDATKVTSWFALIVLQKPINFRHDSVNCFVSELLWIGAAMVGKNPDQPGMNLLIFLPGLFPVAVKPLQHFVESFLSWGLSYHPAKIATKNHKRHKFSWIICAFCAFDGIEPKIYVAKLRSQTLTNHPAS